jgi:peptide/nickel transport system substrate-binding protein
VDGGPVATTYLVPVYDSLLAGNPESLWVQLPGLAREWRWVDETTIEFDLVENVYFSDGVKFDAHVAEANIERMLRLKGPRIQTMTSIRGTEVVDAQTFRIYLHQHDPAILRSLAGPPGMMVSPAAFDNPDLDLNPVGTGPWLYDKKNSTIGEVHRFVPRSDYFEPEVNPSKAYLEVHVLRNPRARLNALISGQVDISIMRPVEAAQAEAAGFSLADSQNRWFGMTILDRNGEMVPELGNPKVRQALGYAVDRNAIANAIFFGYALPASQPMRRPGDDELDLGHVKKLQHFYRYDPEKARTLLREAGVDGFSFVAPVLPDDSPAWEAVQYYLKDVGIDMQIHLLEPGKSGAASRSRMYPVNTITYPAFDPENRHRAIWGSDAIFNPWRVTNKRMDRLAEEARTSSDHQLRKRNFERYFDTVVREAWSVAYLHTFDLVAYDAEKLADVQLTGYIDPHLRLIRLTRQGQTGD